MKGRLATFICLGIKSKYSKTKRPSIDGRLGIEAFKVCLKRDLKAILTKRMAQYDGLRAVWTS